MYVKYLLLLTLIPQLSLAAANYSIVVKEGTTLPDFVLPDEIISAYYTITNQASSPRIGYVLQGLPETPLLVLAAVPEVY